MVDSLSTITTILTNNWTAGNTDSITPTIGKITDYKELDLGREDYILVYEMNEAHRPFGIGGLSFEEKPFIAIDFRTTYKNAPIADVRAHGIKIQEEIKRIIKLKIANPDGTYQLLIMHRKKDLSDKSIGICRMVFDVELTYWGS